MKVSSLLCCFFSAYWDSFLQFVLSAYKALVQRSCKSAILLSCTDSCCLSELAVFSTRALRFATYFKQDYSNFCSSSLLAEAISSDTVSSYWVRMSNSSLMILTICCISFLSCFRVVFLRVVTVLDSSEICLPIFSCSDCHSSRIVFRALAISLKTLRFFCSTTLFHYFISSLKSNNFSFPPSYSLFTYPSILLLSKFRMLARCSSTFSSKLTLKLSH